MIIIIITIIKITKEEEEMYTNHANTYTNTNSINDNNHDKVQYDI